MPPIFELQRPYGFEDPSVLPLLDLVQGAQEAPAHDWGLHPFFERLLREQRSPGQKVGIPLLVPINLLEMPETIPDLEVGWDGKMGEGKMESMAVGGLRSKCSC